LLYQTCDRPPTIVQVSPVELLPDIVLLFHSTLCLPAREAVRQFMGSQALQKGTV
jgi:hypothetical protein